MVITPEGTIVTSISVMCVWNVLEGEGVVGSDPKTSLHPTDTHSQRPLLPFSVLCSSGRGWADGGAEGGCDEGEGGPDRWPAAVGV